MVVEAGEGRVLSLNGLPKLEFEKVLRADAAEIITAREKAQIIHRGNDIDAAGDEVEVAARRVIRRKLPTSYYVGHGHIVDSELTQSPQLDVVISANSDAPILFATENGTEYFPYEAVYAIGEIKSTYYRSKNDVETFTDTVARIKHGLARKQTPPTYLGGDIDPSPDRATLKAKVPYRNPLFSFMVFAESDQFRPSDLRGLYASRPAIELPNVVCLLDKGVIMNLGFATRESGHHLMFHPNPEFNKPSDLKSDETTRWMFNELAPAASFGFLYLLLLEHLRRCQLYSPDLMAYLEKFFAASMGRYESLS